MLDQNREEQFTSLSLVLSVTIPGCTLSAVHRCKLLAPPPRPWQTPTDGDWCVQCFHAAELREERKNAPRLIPSSYSEKARIRLTVLQELHKNLSLTKAWCLSARNKMCCCLVKLNSTQYFLMKWWFHLWNMWKVMFLNSGEPPFFNCVERVGRVETVPWLIQDEF